MTYEVCGSNKSRFLILIIYDITDNKRRNKMVRFLNSFGYRVQKSAFECILTQSQYNKLLKEISFYRNKEDSLRVYKLFSGVEINYWDNIGLNKYEETIII